MNSLPDDPKVLREAIELLGEEVDAERTERELLEGKLVEFAEIMGKFETFSSTVEVQTKRLQEEVKVVTQERDGLALRLSEFSQQSSSPDTGLRELLLQYELEQEQMQGELARVKAETEKRRRTIESLESERDLIQRELAVKEVDEIKGLQQQVESLQARLQKSSKSLEEKERELKNVLRDSDVEGLREQVRKLKADLQQTRTYADEQKKENEDKVDNLRQVKQDSLKDNLVLRELSHNSKIDGLTGQVERLDAELQRMTDLYNASQSENEFMKGDICRLEKDLASLHEVRLELEAARAKAEITKREHEADKVLLDELEEELATLREKEIPLLVKNHKESVEAFDGEIEHSKETSRLAEQRAIELERLLRDLKEESSTARVKLISDHERTVAEASAEVEAMRAKSEISEKRAAELERMMQDLSEKYIQSREEQAARHKQELEWIAVELRQEREKSGMAESKASQLEQTVHIMAKESSLIRAKLDDKIQQLKENERERIRLGKQAQEARELLHVSITGKETFSSFDLCGRREAEV